MKLHVLTAIVFSFWATFVSAQDPIFIVRDRVGTVKEGSIQRILSANSLEMLSADGKSFTITNPVYLNRKNKVSPRFPQTKALWLLNDDCIKFEDLLMKDDSFEFESSDFVSGSKTLVPLLDTKMIWLKNPLGILDPVSYRNKILDEIRTKDVVVLNNAERVEGVLESLDAKNAVLDSGTVKSEYKSDSIALIGLSAEENPKKEKAIEAVSLVLDSGSRITLAEFNLSMGILEGKTMQGAKVRIPITKIQQAVFLGKSVVRIQELKNITLRQVPFFETPMEAKGIKATKNSDLWISGSSYSNGFSTMGSTSITFLLDGKYQKVCGFFGFHDIDGRRGRADIKLLADGKVIASWADRTWKDGLGSLDLTLAGIKELSLVIDASVGSKINWCECLLFLAD
ncbi:MAG: NPCBM/NEW2 domain-containing protein [Planctomycetota bacterium]|nr:NPCBM/NEW2 domain-containing protein [Planctomycetota bacterium]